MTTQQQWRRPKAECRMNTRTEYGRRAAWGLLFAFCILHSALAAQPLPPAPKPNLVIVVLDDAGVDKLRCYGIGCDAPELPVIEGLAAQGLLCRHAYASPLCTSTRAMLQTGRYGFRTGMGTVIAVWPSTTEYDLPLSEITIPERLGRYACGIAGKWHLATMISGGIQAPLNQGWDAFDGTMVNLDYAAQTGYTDWLHVQNGATFVDHSYATTVEIDAAIAMAQSLPQPFVLLVALSAPHHPWHYPPAGLYSVPLSGNPDANPPAFFNAALQAADSELARLLAVLPANTVGFLLGDNGTPGEAMCGPFDPTQEKGTVYEGGVRVPLIVWGAGVTPGVCDALIHAPLDIYATTVRLGGYTGGLGDGVSLQPYLANPNHAPLRNSIYVELFKPNGLAVNRTQYDKAVLDGHWKLIRHLPQAPDELYDLASDPYEAIDLAADGLDAGEQAIVNQLETLWPN